MVDTNPYEAPHPETAKQPSELQPPLSVVVRCLFAMAVIGIVAFELRHAMTHSISWRDAGHWVAAIGAICQFSYMAATGFWTASSRV